MAIDSREKRQAVAVIGLVWLGVNVTPNASPDAEWRQEVGWSYPGIAASGGGAISWFSGLTSQMRLTGVGA